jgi:hypothetical protein
MWTTGARRLVTVGALGAILVGAGSSLHADPGTSPGQVRFFRLTDARFATFIANPSIDQQDWLRAHFWRMLVFAPYFDSRLAWFPDAWVFKDLYAIYPGSSQATEHPEWILRDGAGRPLFIPYQCARGRCPQYAGDVGSPAFRAQWIAEAAATLAPGYRGLFVSDVSLVPRVSTGSRQVVRPIDPRTGRAMAASDWASYVAEFCAEIRAALPGKEIVHDTLWFLDPADPEVQREMDSADFVYFHRGMNDPGIRRGRGTFGFETFLSHIDAAHARGKPVVLESTAASVKALEYNLAGYFLVDAGNDGVGSEQRGDPLHWWSGYDASLGDALGPRYPWKGVQRRDFAGGLVLVNGPGYPARTLPLPHAFVDLEGHERAVLRLGPAQGAVLRASSSTP